MDLTIKADALSEQMASLARAVSKKDTIPVLSYVLVESDGHEQVRFTATDLDVAVRSSCAGTVDDPGSTLLHAKRFAELSKLFAADATVRIAAAGGAVAVTAGAYKGRLQSLPVAEFPEIPTAPSPALPLPVRAFKTMLDQVSFCVAQHDQRYFTNGVYLSLKDGRAVAVGTDGHRMARSSAPVETPTEVSALIAIRALPELASMASTAEDLAFAASDAHLFFLSGQRMLVSRVIDGKFPAHERLFTVQDSAPVVFDRDAMVAALRRVLVASNDARTVTLKVQRDGEIEVSVFGLDGASEEPVPCENASYTGEVMVNGMYLVQHLAASAPGKIEMWPGANQVRLKQADSDVTTYETALAVVRI